MVVPFEGSVDVDGAGDCAIAIHGGELVVAHATRRRTVCGETAAAAAAAVAAGIRRCVTVAVDARHHRER